MNHYYNEFDPKNVAWLRELMEQGHIPHGVIDGRSIKDVAPTDVAGDGQRHFFAGIGGWPLALRIAGWPATRSVWTGSCPCQPYSTAGKRKGSEDERDLWPEFFRLIRDRRPETIFGEQVASGDVVGTELEVAFVAAIQASNYARANRLAERIAKLAAKRNESLDELATRWVDRICADLEAIGYAVWPIVFGAHSVKSPHKRQRLYWMAHSKSSRGCGRESTRAGGSSQSGRSSTDVGVANSNGSGSLTGDEPTQADGHGRPTEPTGGGPVGGGISGPWSDYRVIQCRDGKARRIPVEPEFFPLAHGLPSRVVRLRGYGNAIVPQVAAAFIRAFLETEVGAS